MDRPRPPVRAGKCQIGEGEGWGSGLGRSVKPLEIPILLREFEERYEVFDLVILDMIMPRQSGPETFRKMRAIDPQARILMSSGFSENDSTTALIEAGAVGFLSKPYVVSELSREVARHLGVDVDALSG